MKRLGIALFVYLFFLNFPLTARATGKSVNFSVANEPPTLDWNLATDNVSYRILTNIMEGLTEYDENLKPTPALAESWKTSADGLRLTFFLKKDAVWSDGKPLTAQQFWDSWIRLLNPQTAAEYAYFLYDIKGAQEFNSGKIKNPQKVGIRVLDTHTLEVTLRHPAVFFPAITTFMVTYPIRKDLIQKYGESWTEAQNLVTLGAFQVKKWHHEYKLVLEKNPLYSGLPKPDLDQIQIFIINEGTTALSLYETGDLDYVELPPLAISHYLEHQDFRLQPKLRGYYYGFNLKKPPFNDIRVRKAFSHAINREEFPKILRGGEFPTSSWVPPGMFGYNEKIGLTFDLEKARSSLEQAGFPGGKGFPQIIAAFNTDPLNKIVAENIQAQLKKNLGIKIVLDNQEWKVYLKNLQHDTPGLFRLGWGADYPDPDNFLNLFTSTSGNNHTGWNNKEYDQLIQKATRETNTKARKKLYDRAQVLLCEEEVPIMPLFVVTTNHLVKPHIQGLKLSPLGFIYWKKVKIKSSKN